jgi:hypothetical protein
MAITRTRDTSTAPAAKPPAAGQPDVEKMVTTLTRVFARLAVKTSTCGGAATFAQIVVTELHIATHEEAAAIETWLTSHSG